MDAQSRLETVAGLAALVHALAVGLRRRRGGARAAPGGADGVLVPRRARRHRRDDLVARRAAAGPRGRRRRARARAPLRARPRRRGALEEVERILREGGGADRMREAHAAGGMDEVLARLADETYGSTQTTSPIRSQS